MTIHYQRIERTVRAIGSIATALPYGRAARLGPSKHTDCAQRPTLYMSRREIHGLLWPVVACDGLIEIANWSGKVVSKQFVLTNGCFTTLNSNVSNICFKNLKFSLPYCLFQNPGIEFAKMDGATP